MPRTSSTDRDPDRPHHHHGHHRSHNQSPDSYSDDDYSNDDQPQNASTSSSSRKNNTTRDDDDKSRTRSRSRRGDNSRPSSRGHSSRRQQAGASAGAGLGGVAAKFQQKTGGISGIKDTLLTAGDIIRGSVGEIVDSTLGDEKGARHYQRMTDKGLQNLRSRTSTSPGAIQGGNLHTVPLSPTSQAQREADMARSRADYEEGYQAGLAAAAAKMADQRGHGQNQDPYLSGPPGYNPQLQHQIQPSYLPPPQQIEGNRGQPLQHQQQQGQQYNTSAQQTGPQAVPPPSGNVNEISQGRPL